MLHTWGTSTHVFSGLVAQGLKYSSNTPSAFAWPGISFNVLVWWACRLVPDSTLSQGVAAPLAGRGPAPSGDLWTQLSGWCRSWIWPLHSVPLPIVVLLLTCATEPAAAAPSWCALLVVGKGLFTQLSLFILRLWVQERAWSTAKSFSACIAPFSSVYAIVWSSCFPCLPRQCYCHPRGLQRLCFLAASLGKHHRVMNHFLQTLTASAALAQW